MVDYMGMNLLHRKEQLILTAIEIIDELGIHKLTTREIANRQEVSEATLFRHFKNKNELILAVLDYFVQFDADIVMTIQLRNLEPIQALRYLIEAYAGYYESYPAITSILQLFDVLRYEEGLAKKVVDIHESRTQTLVNMIENAQNSSDIPKNFDSHSLAVLITGLVREICLNWRLGQEKFPLKEKIMSTLDTLLETLNHKEEK